MFYTSAWCLNNEEEFKLNIPLIQLGESIIKFKSTTNLNILFLEGYKSLSLEYIIELNKLNINIIDYEDEFKIIKKEYKNICNEFSNYETNCFLRWIAFKKHFEIQRKKQFFHIDSDIVLHTSLDEIRSEVKDLTFMTLGCPVFLTISNKIWFEQYEKEIKKFNDDINNYLSIDIFNKKDKGKNDYEKFNISLYRVPIASDQDLIEYLISSNKIYQENAELIIKRKYYYVQNPLHISQMSGYYQFNNDIIKTDCMGHIYYGERKIPFTHFQGTFTMITVKLYIIMKKLYLSNRIISKVIRNYKIENEKFVVPLYVKILLKITKKFLNNRTKLISEILKNDKYGEIRLINLLNMLKDK